jgi:hypothetical protein
MKVDVAKIELIDFDDIYEFLSEGGCCDYKTVATDFKVMQQDGVKLMVGLGCLNTGNSNPLGISLDQNIHKQCQQKFCTTDQLHTLEVTWTPLQLKPNEDKSKEVPGDRKRSRDKPLRLAEEAASTTKAASTKAASTNKEASVVIPKTVNSTGNM